MIDFVFFEIFHFVCKEEGAVVRCVNLRVLPASLVLQLLLSKLCSLTVLGLPFRTRKHVWSWNCNVS